MIKGYSKAEGLIISAKHIVNKVRKLSFGFGPSQIGRHCGWFH